MNSIKIELVDNDHVVRAKADLDTNGMDDPFGKFVRKIKEELVTGETAFLEIEGSGMEPVTFEICHCE
jgi:hypothetical protein